MKFSEIDFIVENLRYLESNPDVKIYYETSKEGSWYQLKTDKQSDIKTPIELKTIGDESFLAYSGLNDHLNRKKCLK